MFGFLLTSATVDWIFLCIFHVTNFMTTMLILNINTQIFTFHSMKVQSNVYWDSITEKNCLILSLTRFTFKDSDDSRYAPIGQGGVYENFTNVPKRENLPSGGIIHIEFRDKLILHKRQQLRNE